jgi:site-specific recombinase XerD
MLTQIKQRELARRLGTVDDTAERLRAFRAAPIEEHLEAFEDGLLAKGNKDKYVVEVMAELRRAVAACGYATIADLEDLPRLDAYRRRLREKGKGERTCGKPLVVVKQFSRWLVTSNRATRDPYAGVHGPREATDRLHPRRALTPQECMALLEAPAKVGMSYNLDPETRRMAYLVVLRTGFRLGSVISLVPESFRFFADRVAVTVQSGSMKNRKSLTNSIRKPRDVAAVREFLTGKPAGVPLFPLPEQHAAKMLRRDEAAVGIEYETAEGCADFHALRHSFATQEADAGVHPKTLQKLLGHSNINLTMKYYTHMKAEDEIAAAAALPDLVQPKDAESPPRILPMEGA